MSIYFEKARELGLLILDSDEAQRLKKASDNLSQDRDVVDKINAFQDYQEKVAKLISGGMLSQAETDAKSEELKHRFEELKKQPLIIERSEADAEYEALVKKVLDILKLTLGLNIESESCGGCGSCKKA